MRPLVGTDFMGLYERDTVNQRAAGNIIGSISLNARQRRRQGNRTPRNRST
jgi:hypothetical protein